MPDSREEGRIVREKCDEKHKKHKKRKDPATERVDPDFHLSHLLTREDYPPGRDMGNMEYGELFNEVAGQVWDAVTSMRRPRARPTDELSSLRATVTVNILWKFYGLIFMKMDVSSLRWSVPYPDLRDALAEALCTTCQEADLQQVVDQAVQDAVS